MNFRIHCDVSERYINLYNGLNFYEGLEIGDKGYIWLDSKKLKEQLDYTIEYLNRILRGLNNEN